MTPPPEPISPATLDYKPEPPVPLNPAPALEWKIEVIILPVADVDRSLEFYRDRLGFTLDVDHCGGENFRVVQFTPRGSACSVMFGKGVSEAEVGSVRGVHLVVADIVAAHAELSGRGLAVSPIRHMTPSGWQDGVDPEHARYNSFADFADPDGNTWVLQEVPAE